MGLINLYNSCHSANKILMIAITIIIVICILMILLLTFAEGFYVTHDKPNHKNNSIIIVVVPSEKK